jgi:site-specific DNA recombinase
VTLAIEPASASVVRRIFEMYAAGSGYTRIAKRLNDERLSGPWGGSWDGSAIREMLRNDAYRGARIYGRTKKIKTAHGTRSKRPRPEEARTIKEGAHPAIIEPALWERVKDRREAVAKVYQASGHRFGTTRSVQTQFLLTGLLKCGVCGANFATRVAHTLRGGGRYFYYGCAFRARRGKAVCDNPTLLPQDAIERDLLDLLQQAVLTPATLARLLKAVNAKLCAQATISRPRLTELRKALALVDREIANYTRAISKGNFTSLEHALTAAEQRRGSLQAELAKLDGGQPSATIQLTPGALDRHLQGMTEKLRSGVNGKVREAIQQSVARILVGGDGDLTIEAKLEGLLGVGQGLVPLPEEDGTPLRHTTLINGRQWTVMTVA